MSSAKPIAIAIASGKGGVGKSTVAVNLGVVLAQRGSRVGLLDADVYGPNCHIMLGVDRMPPSSGTRMNPAIAHGVRVMSMGFLVKPGQPLAWRGPMLHSAIRQFVNDVEWGDLDYLLVDLPPGTGDVSMTLAQLLPQAQFVIVTTPQQTAQKVARRSADMANKVNLEVAGVIENMAGFVAPDGERYQIFGEGGGQELADEIGVPLIAKVPLTMPLREQADAGVPLVISDPDDPAAQSIRQAARGLIAIFPAELPMIQAEMPADAADADGPEPVGMTLPMA